MADAGRGIAELSRLRCLELLPRGAGLRDERRLQAVRGRRASSRHPCARGHGAEPRVQRASLLQGSAARHELTVSQLVPLLSDQAGAEGTVGTGGVASLPRARRVLLRNLLERN